MHYGRVRWFALFAVLAALALPSAGIAQTTTGAVRGYVRDQGGAPLADAQITARNAEIGASRTAITNASGFYNLAGLRPGRYELSARHIGHTPRTQTIQIPIAQTVTADLVLQSGAVQLQAVTVSASENVTIKSSEVGMNVSAAQIRDLPLFDRNFLDLAKLAPGITPKNVNDDTKSISAGGQPAEAINIFIDGASYKNDVLKGGVLAQDQSKGNPFPQGAVQEFRIITQNYKAEYQKASSAIITATTKTGGNQWETDIFGFAVGKSYVAKDAAAERDARARSNYERLQAGGSIGGPITRDKLFFFGTYELNSRDEPRDVILGSNAPLAPPGLNPQQYAGRFTSTFREHLAFTKLTWIKSDLSTIDGSFNFRRDDDFRDFGGGDRSYEAAENMKVDTYTGVANWRRAGGRWLNEAQINLQRGIWSPEPKNPNLIGKLYHGIVRIGGRDTKQQFTQDRIALRNDVTRSPFHWAGEHIVKTGASVDFLNYEGIKHQFGNPLYEFRTDENYLFPFQALIGFGDPSISRKNTQVGAYIQDDWDVTNKLTLNLGVRWDVETNGFNNDYSTPQPLADSLRNQLAAQFFVDRPTPSGNVQVRVIDQLGGIGNFITSGRRDRPMFLEAIQPRLGASYDIRGDGRTVLFGGFGIYNDRNYWNTLFDEQYRRQFKVLRMEFNSTGPTAACPRCVQWNDQYYDPAQLQTLASSGQSGLPEVFLVKNDLRPPKSHQMTAGVRQQWGQQLITVSYNGVRGYNGMNFIRATPFNGLTPNYSTAFVTDDRVKTWYDALQLQVERPLARSRWGGSLAYTLANTEEQGQSTDLFWGFDDRYPTVADMPRKKAPGSQTHTFAANAVTRLPYDFLLSGIVNLGSGIRENATDASQGFGPFERRFYVYEPPTKAFLGLGNVFATQNLDLRLQKDLSVRSGQSATVILDLFNAFNTENWGCYNTQIDPTSGPPNANYGRPNCAGLGRRLQIGLRYGARSGSSSESGNR
jgi:hypothetical protein